LVERVTGRRLDAGSFLTYLEGKLAALSAA
jgi:carboxypeptidase Taq